MVTVTGNQTTESVSGKPKAFLSYSWSSPEYADRVEALAKDLVGHGVEVVFDQWDLSDGQDLHSFMEQAVNDPTEPPFAVLQRRNDIQRLGKIDFAAHLIMERVVDSEVPRDALMEADLLLCYRCEVETGSSSGFLHSRWYPRTMVYMSDIQRLPLFERSRTPEFFDRLAPVLGVRDRADFIERFKAIRDFSFYRIGNSLADRESFEQQLGIASP